MRDPQRIPVVLDAIRRAWERSPDLRLGHLLAALTHQDGRVPDPFYVEDDAVLEAALAMVQTGVAHGR